MCISPKAICDKAFNCPNSTIDESVQCNSCPQGYCLNDGKCESYEGGANCTCADDYTGYRCSVKKSRNVGKEPPTTIIVASVAGAVVVLAAVIIGIFFFVRRRQMNADAQKLGTGMENPAYDMQLSDLSTSAPFSDTTNMQPLSEGLENPLYGDLDP